MKLLSKRIYDLSSSTFIELGIKIDETCTPSLHFVIKNIRNIEIALNAEIYEKIFSKREVIRKFLEKSSSCTEKDIPLSEDLTLCFIDFSGQRGLSIRGIQFHVSFLAKAAYQFLSLRNSILCYLDKLQSEVEIVPRKIEKLIKIIASVLKNQQPPLALEDLLSSNKINNNCQMENELLSLYFDQIYREYELRWKKKIDIW